MSLSGKLAITTASAFLANAMLLSACAAQKLDVPYEPSTTEIVATMLKLANTGPQDVVYDLGSGDGRIVVAAVRDFGARKGVGVDINPERIAEARHNASQAGVSDRATFVEGNLFDFDFREATVLTMYLLPHVNLQLRPRILSELPPGTRVVSHRFDMGDWEADRIAKVGTRQIYFWLVPARVEGSWAWEVGPQRYRVDLRQQYQKITGRLRGPAGEAAIENAQLSGERIRFDARIGDSVVRFDGKVAGNAIDATVESSGRTAIVARRVE